MKTDAEELKGIQKTLVPKKLTLKLILFCNSCVYNFNYAAEKDE